MHAPPKRLQRRSRGAARALLLSDSQARTAACSDVARRGSPPCRMDTSAAAPARAAPAPAGEDISVGRQHFSVAQRRCSFAAPHGACPRSSSHNLALNLAHALATRCDGGGGSRGGGGGFPACTRTPCRAARRRRRRPHSRSDLRQENCQAARGDGRAPRPGGAGMCAACALYVHGIVHACTDIACAPCVQASSVQAWSEAAAMAADPLLDAPALRAAIDACAAAAPPQGQSARLTVPETPRARGQATGCPATALGIRASRLQSRRFYRL